jgi:uncharacterized UPF0160 family protein
MKTILFKGFKSEDVYTYDGGIDEKATPIIKEITLKDILTRKNYDYMEPDFENGKFVPANLNDIGVVTIATHNGVFHSDDITAVASIVARLKRYNIDYKIIRTRDQEIINKADVVIDVGGVYDPDNLRFDHHQDENLGSSIKLLYDNNIGSKLFTDDVVDQIDEQDRGLANNKNNPFIKWVTEMNSLDLSKNDEKFNEAILFILDTFKNNNKINLENVFRKKADELSAKKQEIIEKFKVSIKGMTPDSDGVFFFDKDDNFLPFWKEEFCGLKHPEARWIVFWDKIQQLWTIQVVPTDPKNPFEFPKENSLIPLEGDNNTVFVHKNGFIAKVKDWKKAIEELDPIAL